MSRGYAVVSGGSGALGSAVARRLAAAGHPVVVLDRAAPADGSEFLAVDLADAESTTQIVQRLLAERGAPTVLVLCHGWSPKGADGASVPESEVPIPQFREVLEVNLTSAFLLLRLVIPAMAEAGTGRVVVVGSAAAHTGRTTAGAAYAAAKAGLSALVRVFAVRYGPAGVLVNDLAPGKLANPDWPDSAAAVDRYRQDIPLGRLGTADEVAQAIAFLVSEHNTYLSGQTLIIDGGRLA